MLQLDAEYLIARSSRQLNQRDREIARLKENIRKDHKWFRQITEKAYKRNISVDSMIHLYAEYLIKVKTTMIRAK